LQSPDLKAEPAVVNSVPATLETELLLLGAPFEFGIGKTLVSAKGSLTGLPSDSTDKLLVLTVPPKPGNQGGPVCDKAGRLIGIVASKVSSAVLSDGYSTATPIGSAISFVKKHVRGELSTQPDAKALEWSEVEARANSSAVLILMQKKP
jgi:S1-C subfamily serine protease